MDEMAGVRKKMRRILARDVPERIWEDRDVRDMAQACLEETKAGIDLTATDTWGALEDAVRRALHFWDGGREEGLGGVQSGVLGGSPDMHEAASRDSVGTKGLNLGWFVSDRTAAMVGAMSALFAHYGDQIPVVKQFRDRALPRRFLTAEEAHSLIASYAARVFDLRLFERWNIPLIGHESELVEHDTDSDRGGVYMRATVRVDPPGITKTVRYVDSYNSLEKEDVEDTRAQTQNGAVVPLIRGLPISRHGSHVYPSWLWPGSVVDELYDLSVELARAFDWPLASAGNLSGTRPLSESAAWFILTGEAPRVRPLEARWETKQGSTHLPPQWRVRLTIPPWLPEEEILRALRLLRKQVPKGRKLPKEARTLEVARFVYEQKRLHGYQESALWTAWLERWNETYPGNRFKSASHFRTYFLRGNEAVKRLNFQWPRSGERPQPSPNQPVLTAETEGFDVPIPDTALE